MLFCVLTRSAFANAYRDDVVGVGVLKGSNAGVEQHALVLEGNHHFRQQRAHMNLRQYGLTDTRLEVGSGFGVAMAATAGITWVGLEDGESGVALQLGSELFNGRLAYRTQEGWDRFYEWLPAGSLGVQMGGGGCRLLALARGGAAIGNRAKEGAIPAFRYAYGSGAYLNCSRLDLAVEWLRTFRELDDSQSKLVDLSLRVGPPRDLYRIGLRGEGLGNERRVLAIFRIGLE